MLQKVISREVEKIDALRQYQSLRQAYINQLLKTAKGRNNADSPLVLSARKVVDKFWDEPEKLRSVIRFCERFHDVFNENNTNYLIEHGLPELTNISCTSVRLEELLSTLADVVTCHKGFRVSNPELSKKHQTFAEEHTRTHEMRDNPDIAEVSAELLTFLPQLSRLGQADLRIFLGLVGDYVGAVRKKNLIENLATTLPALIPLIDDLKLMEKVLAVETFFAPKLAHDSRVLYFCEQCLDYTHIVGEYTFTVGVVSETAFSTYSELLEDREQLGKFIRLLYDDISFFGDLDREIGPGKRTLSEWFRARYSYYYAKALYVGDYLAKAADYNHAAAQFFELCHARCGNRALMEDLVHKVYSELCNGEEVRLDSPEALSSWVMQRLNRYLGNEVKCVLVDADNTLWSGILEELGVAGLTVPYAYAEFQQWLKSLQQNGVLLVLLSRNNREDVLAALAEHPDMVLRKEDFVGIVANWEDKARNLEGFIGSLELSPQNFLFLDDSTHERDSMRKAFPEVLIPEVSASLINRLAMLDALSSDKNLFPQGGSALTSNRTELYRQKFKREELKKAANDEAKWLASLNMRTLVTSGQENTKHISRLAELSRRTNRFNLNPNRYSEEDIRSLLLNPGYEVLSFQMEDTVGDDGIVGLAVLRREDCETLVIEEFALSCRALRRTMDATMIAFCLDLARREGFSRVRGLFRETERNIDLKDFYSSKGLTATGASEDGLLTQWEAPVAGLQPCYSPWIRVSFIS